MRILAPSLVLMTVFTVCDNMLAGDGRAAVTAYILAGTLCVIAGVSWLAIPRLGICGTALAVLCGNAFTAAASLMACSRLYGIRVRRCLFMQGKDFRFVQDSLFRRPAEKAPQKIQS
jgi:O-antigen/teichoic acid export membrane protein